MGPQFTFKTFSHNEMEVEKDASSLTAVLQPTNDVSDMMDEVSHLSLNSIHSSHPYSSLSAATNAKGREGETPTLTDPADIDAG